MQELNCKNLPQAIAWAIAAVILLYDVQVSVAWVSAWQANQSEPFVSGWQGVAAKVFYIITMMAWVGLIGLMICLRPSRKKPPNTT